MTKDLIKDFFGLSETEFNEMWAKASKIFENLSEKCENDNKTESYYNSLHKSYNNGKLIKKSEKEYVNGKCVKDENYNALDNKTNKNRIHKFLAKNGVDEKKCIRKRSELLNEIEELKKKNTAMQSQIEDMTRYIDGLNDKIKQIEIEKAELKSIVDNIKNCF